MKTQLSIQEKLWDLRKERKLNLEEVATAVDISPATLSNYENKDYKDISLSLLTKLAKYYQVSLDWLAGLSETKRHRDRAGDCHPNGENAGKSDPHGTRPLL